MLDTMLLRMSRELRDLVEQEAIARRVPITEVAVEILADHYGRPELREIPRKRAGRPRKVRQPV